MLGTARKVVPISEDEHNKIPVKQDLKMRLYGDQGQNKIRGAHLGYVGIAIQGTEGRTDGQPRNIMSCRSYRAGDKK